jgi:hypothetical protein
MTKRLVNVGLQLHVERSCDDVTSQDAFGSIESSLSDVFHAAVEPPSSRQTAGTVVHPRAVLCWTRVLILLRTVIWRSTGLVDKLAGRHHRVPMASRAVA